MLKSLLVNNYVLIDRLLFEPGTGLTVLTGETGAGKSIIIDALGLILGNRLSAGFTVNGEDKCVVEAIFNVAGNDVIRKLLIDNDLDSEETLVVRREILKTGKSRAFVNDTPVTLQVLEEITSNLVDLHNQFANQAIGQDSFRLMVVDSVAGTLQQAGNFTREFSEFQVINKTLEEKKSRYQILSKETDFIDYQLNLIKATGISTSAEFTEIEQEARFLNQSEELKSMIFECSQRLSGNENDITENLRECDALLAKAARKSDYIQVLSERIHSLFIEVKDIAAETEMLLQKLDVDPQRLTYLNEKLDQVYSLFNKFRIGSFEELSVIETGFAQKIDEVKKLAEEIEDIEKELSHREGLLVTHAEVLSKKREAVFNSIERKTVAMLQQLGMPNAQFSLVNSRTKKPGIDGIDNIQFLFTANKNTQAGEIGETASGGELSRIMLCLKSLINAENAIPTLIFDEIDTGVSGEIADKMGAIMQQLSAGRQVISITHLPQVAARGKQHYKVVKTEEENRTRTSIMLFNEAMRIEELAAMLSGSEITGAARNQAELLLRSAGL